VGNAAFLIFLSVRTAAFKVSACAIAPLELPPLPAVSDGVYPPSAGVRKVMTGRCCCGKISSKHPDSCHVDQPALHYSRSEQGPSAAVCVSLVCTATAARPRLPLLRAACQLCTGLLCTQLRLPASPAAGHSGHDCGEIGVAVPIRPRLRGSRATHRGPGHRTTSVAGLVAGD
jgi:hypothetical protein